VIVTLLTDFATNDYFVGAMKGVILSQDPRIQIVDLSHDIGRHDVEAAAFTLSAVYRDFPGGTVHVVVVDPGVGSTRNALAVKAADQFLVGPDNGVFSYVLDRETPWEARLIEARELRRPPGSTTFQGRDVFAPAAAALVTGYEFTDVGGAVEEPVRLPPLGGVEPAADGGMRARIVHVDHFGNCVTGFTPHVLAKPEGFEYWIGGEVIRDVRESYSGAAPGIPFVIWGSAGFLEISVDRGSAAERLGLERGDSILARPRTP
jgi:S-adenosyl-L-methionine hydrolase (adenosine-forming)